MGNEQEATGQQAEEVAQEASAQVETGAPEEATGQEAKGQQEAEQTTEQTQDDKKDEKQRNREGYERRQERRRLRQLEIENAELRGFQKGMQSAGKTEQKTPADGYAVPKPTQNADEPYEDFLLRLQNWNLDKRDFEQGQKGRQQAEATKVQSKNDKISAQRTAGEAKYPDFEDIVSDLMIPNEIFEDVLESEVGHDIAYYFGQNPKEMERISKLPEKQRIKEMTRLEDKLKATPTTTQKQSKAPEPPPIVRAGSVVSDDANYLSDSISPAERIRISRERKAARGN